MASSNRKQMEVLSEISDLIVKLSDEDLERMESLAEQITSFDPELGDRILDAYALLTQLNDDVETALERMEPDTEDMEGEEDFEIAEVEEPTEAAKIGLIIISDVIMHELNPPLTAESTQQPVRALSWLEDLTNKHWRYDLFTYARSVSEVNRRSLGVRG